MFRQIIHIITIILFKSRSSSNLIAVLAPIVLHLQSIILIEAVRGLALPAAGTAATVDVMGLRLPIRLDCIVIIPDYK